MPTGCSVVWLHTTQATELSTAAAGTVADGNIRSSWVAIRLLKGIGEFVDCCSVAIRCVLENKMKRARRTWL